MIEEYIADGASQPWQTFQRPGRGELRVRALLDGAGGGPEAVHSIHAPGTSHPHFHLGAQFQLVLSGAATFPKHRADAIGVHYTDHGKPYGPFDFSENYSMMVLHAKPAGQVNLTGPTADKEKSRQRNPRGREIIRSAGQAEWEPSPEAPGARRKVLFLEASGLGAEIREAPAGASLTFEAAPYGQFQIVVEGSAKAGDREIGRNGLRFVRGVEPASPLESGPEGATVVVLTYDEDAAKSYGGTAFERCAEIEQESRSLKQR
jgi:hypothetical protein